MRKIAQTTMWISLTDSNSLGPTHQWLEPDQPPWCWLASHLLGSDSGLWVWEIQLGSHLSYAYLGTRHAQATVEATVCMVMHQYYASPSPPSSCDCFLSPRHQPAFLDRCSRIIINSWGRATTLGENGNSHMDCNYYHISFLLGRRAFHLKRWN